ncbi:uncharacterized protein LOC119719608 [Patiria miniata]|uniref:Uncharacterized protein n=1 Tax=Patiria miniata TaxID=46514 RepID=A0A913Z028_PATMI|nr:uncharacterized protein LOC119719608 [Patiria miniata]
MEEVYDAIEENAGAYGDAAGPVGALFKGLCSAFKISEKCFLALVEDGWDEVQQLADLTGAWKAHVLALAPNGGQKRNLEKLIERVEAGPLEGQVPKRKRRHDETDPPSQVAATQQEPDKDQGAGPSGSAAAGQTATESTTSQVHTLLPCIIIIRKGKSPVFRQ